MTVMIFSGTIWHCDDMCVRGYACGYARVQNEGGISIRTKDPVYKVWTCTDGLFVNVVLQGPR